jgi:hypothetical protein
MANAESNLPFQANARNKRLVLKLTLRIKLSL